MQYFILFYRYRLKKHSEYRRKTEQIMNVISLRFCDVLQAYKTYKLVRLGIHHFVHTVFNLILQLSLEKALRIQTQNRAEKKIS